MPFGPSLGIRAYLLQRDPGARKARPGGLVGYVADRADNEQVFKTRLPATPRSVGVFRAQFRDWLEDMCVNGSEVFDIVLASSESLNLVIEDLPRRVALVVDIEARLDGNQLTITTRDYGLWHESRARAQDDPLGLALMRALMDSVELERHGDGHTITLGRRVRFTDREQALPI